MMPAGTAPSGWVVSALAPSLAVRVTQAMPELAPDLEMLVAAQWDAACADRPALFNGTVFSADSITPSLITGHWTEYRRVLAQIRAPALFERLRIRSLAVTGLLECADGLLLGRRETGSVYQAGLWQSPPAGSVERRAAAADSASGGVVDLEEQLLAECEEELGLAAAAVELLRPVAAIEHPHSHIVDIGFLLRTPLGFAEVERRWQAGGNREYDRLLRLDFSAARGPAQPGRIAVLPTTQALLDSWLQCANSP